MLEALKPYAGYGVMVLWLLCVIGIGVFAAHLKE